MVKSVLAILVAVLVFSSPVRAGWNTCACRAAFGSPDASTPSEAGAASPGESACCSQGDRENERDEPSDDRHSEGCDCPLACCGTVGGFAVSYRAAEFRTILAEADERLPVVRAEYAPAHVDRLKRPPRRATTV